MSGTQDSSTIVDRGFGRACIQVGLLWHYYAHVECFQYSEDTSNKRRNAEFHDMICIICM